MLATACSGLMPFASAAASISLHVMLRSSPCFSSAQSLVLPVVNRLIGPDRLAVAARDSAGFAGACLGELAELFFVASDVGRDGIEALAELVDLHGEAGEGQCVAGVLSVFFHEGAEFGSAVEGGSADTGPLGDGVEGDRFAGAEEVAAGLFDALCQCRSHALWAWAMSRSRRSTSWLCRAASAVQPRWAASAARAAASARWAARMGRNVASVRRFGQCSQMLA